MLPKRGHPLKAGFGMTHAARVDAPDRAQTSSLDHKSGIGPGVPIGETGVCYPDTGRPEAFMAIQHPGSNDKWSG